MFQLQFIFCSIVTNGTALQLCRDTSLSQELHYCSYPFLTITCSKYMSCVQNVVAEPQPFMVLFFGRPQGYGFHRIKNVRNCDQEFVAPFNSNFHNKTLCESGVMWITRFVTYLSIAFHIYLLIIIYLQLIIIKNVSILTDFTYLVPPCCLCGILALRSHDF